MEQSLNVFDLMFIGLVGIFSFIGLTRGAIREVFSVINIILSAIVTLVLSPFVSHMLLSKVKLQIVADVISNSAIFTISLILISFTCSGMIKTLNEKFPIYLNQPIGFALGFLKGYLIMALSIMTMFSIYEVSPEGKNDSVLPDFIVNAKTYGFVKTGVKLLSPISDKILNGDSTNELIKNFLPSDLKEDKETNSEKKSNKSKKSSKTNSIEENLDDANNRYDKEYEYTKENEDAVDEAGYDKEDRNKITGLIDIFADDEELSIQK